jgi:hypothetical protein
MAAKSRKMDPLPSARNHHTNLVIHLDMDGHESIFNRADVSKMSCHGIIASLVDVRRALLCCMPTPVLYI